MSIGSASRTARFSVSQLMEREVVTVAPATPVPEVARLLRRYGISGVPVVDERGSALGTVSATDLVRLAERVSPETLREGRRWREVDGLRVEDVMTPDAFGVAPTATLGDLVDFFARTCVHRALVLEGRRVVGVVSVTDLLRFLTGDGASLGERPD